MRRRFGVEYTLAGLTRPGGLAADAVLVLAPGFALGRDGRDTLAAIERLAAGEELAVDRWHGRDAQGVALAAPYGHPLVERGPLGGLQVGRAEEVRDLARHVEGDRQLQGGGALLRDAVVVGHEVGDRRANRAAADAVVAGEGSNRAALHVCGADGVGLVGRHGGPTAALAALGLGGA
ncbi:hypothetical protein ACFXMT_28305 [Streptomyces mirabilis]|uniref:hypothetical protein n=1 Tax=Streptomyces mirabilis TaxID=68239 RepID=UPI0036A9A25A